MLPSLLGARTQKSMFLTFGKAHKHNKDTDGPTQPSELAVWLQTGADGIREETNHALQDFMVCFPKEEAG